MNLVFSLVLFAFCINGMIYVVAISTNNSFLLDTASSELLDPENQLGTDGELTETMQSMSSGGGFVTGLLGNPTLALQMVLDILSGQYLVHLIQSILGFPPAFNWIMGIVLGVLNIATFVQLIRGINFGL